MFILHTVFIKKYLVRSWVRNAGLASNEKIFRVQYITNHITGKIKPLPCKQYANTQ